MKKMLMQKLLNRKNEFHERTHDLFDRFKEIKRHVATIDSKIHQLATDGKRQYFTKLNMHKWFIVDKDGKPVARMLTKLYRDKIYLVFQNKDNDIMHIANLPVEGHEETLAVHEMKVVVKLHINTFVGKNLVMRASKHDLFANPRKTKMLKA